MEYILLSAGDYGDFIVLRGERVKTETLPFWPFFQATFRLDKASARQLGQTRITVSESEILSDSEVPEVPVIPVEASVPKPPVRVPSAPVQSPKPEQPMQLTLWETA